MMKSTTRARTRRQRPSLPSPLQGDPGGPVTAIPFDPFSDAQREDPYPGYAELRRHSPVTKIETLGAYVVARYSDVTYVLRHPELFSSSAMHTSLTNPDGSGTALPAAEAARLAEAIPAMHNPIPES